MKRKTKQQTNTKTDKQMRVSDIAQAINNIVPPELAQDWDNTGLLIGDNNKPVKNILLTIDTTKQVLAEAVKLDTDLIVSYHPVIWDGLKKITAQCPDSVVYELIRSNISVFSIHTALDAAVGGVNDALAEIVGIENAEPIGDYIQHLPDKYKLVVFVPQDSLKKVTNAVYKAGAGAIGNYSNCGFAGSGTGTFRPLSGSNPAIGEQGRLEKVAETRFETIVPAEKIRSVIAAMKQAHPYEEPAFDVIKLYNDNNRFGLGRIGRLNKPATVEQIVSRIKKITGAKAVGFVGPRKKHVKTAAVCAGSCGKIINQVIAHKADLYLTGELKHHQALAAEQAKLTCLCLSHTVSERFILKKFAEQLKNKLKSVTIRISKKDADPFTWEKI